MMPLFEFRHFRMLISEKYNRQLSDVVFAAGGFGRDRRVDDSQF